MVNRLPTILVVDDDEVIQLLFIKYFKQKGHQVLAAQNGLEALGILASQDVDIIFMDLNMPVMDGLTATKFIRACEQGQLEAIKGHRDLAQVLSSKIQGSRIPIVAVTGVFFQDDIILDSGVNVIIRKPFTAELAAAAVSKYCTKN